MPAPEAAFDNYKIICYNKTEWAMTRPQRPAAPMGKNLVSPRGETIRQFMV